MKHFTLIFHDSRPITKDAATASIPRWKSWFQSLGPALVDEGAPLKNGKRMVAANSISENKSSISGYCVVAAKDEEAAMGLIKNCPIFIEGGSVDLLTNIAIKHL